MKKLTLSLLCAAGLAINAAGMAAAGNSTEGIYINADVGYGNTAFSNFATINQIDGPLNSFRNKGFAWGADLGYQFSPYFAVEGGYLDLASVKTTINNGQIIINDPVHGIFNQKIKVNGTDKISTYALYLAAKGMYPINTKLDIFGKVGVAYVHTKESTNFTFDNVEHKKGYLDDTASNSQWTPLLGVGAEYNIDGNLGLNIQALYTFKHNNVPHTFTGLAGLNYKIST